MKRILTLFLLLLFAACAAGAEESIIIDKTRGENADFAFDEDAQLLEIFFPDIYGCDAAIVRCGEYSMLIDCAGSQWPEVKSLLDQLNMTELTYALNSHPDRDHIGGFAQVLKDIPAGEFLLGFPEYDPSGSAVSFRVYDALHELSIPLRQVQNGDTIAFGDVSVTVYQCTGESLSSTNDKSVMLMIQYGERRFFFAGDIQIPAETQLIENAAALDLKTDILKYPHHSYMPLQEAFLEMLSPSYAICTCGNYTKGLKQMDEVGIPYLITATRQIRLATDGRVWTIETLR